MMFRFFSRSLENESTFEFIAFFTDGYRNFKNRFLRKCDINFYLRRLSECLLLWSCSVVADDVFNVM